MTATDVHTRYLERLLDQPDFDLLRKNRISAIVNGSSADSRVDSNSDWDYKIFVEEADIRPFVERHGEKFSLSDNTHDPKVFVMIRPFGYLESELESTLAITLWICEKAKVLRDDGGSFQQRVSKYRAKFESTLPEQLQHKYLKLRTRRHGIDGVVKRSDALAARMLAQDCIKISLQILHLVHGKTYPYPQWLYKVSADEYSQSYSETFGTIKALGLELEASQIQAWSRKLVGNMIDIMVAKGFDRLRLERWWEYI
ncbi:MAG: hypothetical protein CO183_01715 [Candidatus Zambryskibacteria bacterium CG_4_9_14_3_um_filter_42_9]|uniref:DUF4037 domain-containing protein n=1 Tax=Candidatus Zambryskibacteria bacterium CG22_combo_CG10-13_8_21_14_all_42_17 TaxID=1975118 RepID=A0A2H0BE25_9BACT|nr:MAG: hypothetical protein COX06_00875 [Candidatus Zambryskibacteria bacterium CG22_combo_CG10-13_8_21_14_all_42_17]PJA36783.1 MAG: hypothetical protein CO183_01715 [Candidatus Zambryskibacteria bacterium CG_4_9_14_3_um_filter_42_9]